MSETQTVRSSRSPWFGTSWNPLFCHDHDRIEPPTHLACGFCLDLIGAADRGLLIVHTDPSGVRRRTRPIHLDCFIRVLVGGVSHQLGQCACYGGCLPHDPPSLSKREAASVAAKTFVRRMRCDAVVGSGAGVDGA